MKVAAAALVVLSFLLVVPTMAQVQPQTDTPHETPGVLANVHLIPDLAPGPTIAERPARAHVKVADKKFWLVAGLELAATAADLETTQWAIGSNPNAYEANPIFGRRPSRLRQYGIAMPITAVAIGFQYHAKKRAMLTGKGKHTWWVASLPMTGLHTFLAYHNATLVP